ncbi:MAG: hypothetical protein P9C36_05725 [Defluviicoccus sp.]|nr:hypothetical protein [Defluviicoccus sp.]MDG4592108.1 hypothetical protein [Defluviicoccus sp.]MDS4074256.1 hypothetical protein [Defluviicoccus sp.]
MTGYLSRLLPPAFLHVPENNSDRLNALARRIVMMFARGNYRLQTGRYVTKRQIDERYKKLRDVDFER